MEPTYLGLGANLARPGRHLLTAVAELSRRLGPLRAAPLYRTEPISNLPQPRFLNSVVEVFTDLPAAELLALAQELERAAGRRPGPRNGPRPLDVDLLVVRGERRTEPELTLPHPRLAERAFVLAPLAALAPGLRPAGTAGATVAELLVGCESQGIERIGWSELLVGR